MTTLEDADLFTPTPPNLGAAPPRRCRHPKAYRGTAIDGELLIPWCRRCNHAIDLSRARRGRQSRNYGTRAELDVARRYGGVKVGHAGGPVDVRGKDWSTQVKTHRRLPPAEWRKAFANMAASSGVPRLLLRFLPGPGLPPDDYFVIPAKAWLEWWGKDE